MSLRECSDLVCLLCGFGIRYLWPKNYFFEERYIETIIKEHWGFSVQVVTTGVGAVGAGLGLNEDLMHRSEGGAKWFRRRLFSKLRSLLGPHNGTAPL